MLNGGGGDQGKNLVQALHETARMLQSAMEEQSTLTRGPWFAQKWLGIDKNAWLKSLAYQANSFHRTHLSSAATSFEDLGMILCSIVSGHKRCMFTSSSSNLYLVFVPHPSLGHSSSWFAWIRDQIPGLSLWRIIILSVCKLGFFTVLIISVCLQVAVHSLLQAVEEIVIRGEGRDSDTCIFVHHR
jgi:hypothetical protein